MARVRATTRCRLVIAGDGPARAEAGAGSRRWAWLGGVDLAGYLAGADLDSAYRAADIFVLPSYSRGLPAVLLEAMSEGLPMVAAHQSQGCHRPAAPRRERPVRASPARPASSPGPALLRLLGDSDLRAAMAANNREKVKITPDVVARRYVTVLESVIHETGARPLERRAARRGSATGLFGRPPITNALPSLAFPPDRRPAPLPLAARAQHPAANC